MKFWDSSALVPLLIVERRSAELRALFEADQHLIVSFITPLELTSAIHRRTTPSKPERIAAERQMALLEEGWFVVERVSQILSRARTSIERYRLRTGDGIQLATALIACREDRSTLPFVTLDDELRDAASSEGFPTLP